jgi:hypothetical protein
MSVEEKARMQHLIMDVSAKGALVFAGLGVIRVPTRIVCAQALMFAPRLCSLLTKVPDCAEDWVPTAL